MREQKYGQKNIKPCGPPVTHVDPLDLIHIPCYRKKFENSTNKVNQHPHKKGC